jgi:hypothetical protein
VLGARRDAEAFQRAHRFNRHEDPLWRAVEVPIGQGA